MTDLSDINKVGKVGLQSLSLEDWVEAPLPVLPVLSVSILDTVVTNQWSVGYLQLNCSGRTCVVVVVVESCIEDAHINTG